MSLTGPHEALSFRSAKRFLADQFKQAGLPFADGDATDLVLGLCDLSQTDYVVHGAEIMPADQIEVLRNAAKRRLAGEPVDRILGWREFYGRRFNIQNVLSPRGDTEVLLLAALDAVSDISAPHCLDLGTGSGALAISLLCERTDATAIATDLEKAALSTAQGNAKYHHVLDRLTLIQSDWFQAVPQKRFDAIVSNPPYITSEAMKGLDPEVANHDPHLALHGGMDGLNPYRQIIPKTQDYLKPDGCLGVEIGYDQGQTVRDLFESSLYSEIEILSDPAGLDRVVMGRFRG